MEEIPQLLNARGSQKRRYIASAISRRLSATKAAKRVVYSTYWMYYINVGPTCIRTEERDEFKGIKSQGTCRFKRFFLSNDDVNANSCCFAQW